MGGLIIDLTLISFLPENLAVSLFLWRLLLPLLVMGWCLFNGRVREKEPTKLALLGIFIVPPVGYVIYCFWSRGGRGFLPILYALLPIVAVATAFVLLDAPAPGSVGVGD